jgi:transposase
VGVHPADTKDPLGGSQAAWLRESRDGGLLVLQAARELFPFIERIFADGGDQGAATATATRALGPWQIEIVKRSDLHRVVVLPKRWIVERIFTWMGRNRRLSKVYENTTRFATASLWLAMTRLMLRWLLQAKLS